MTNGELTPAVAIDSLLTRAQLNDWAGADPYDGLLSRLGRAAVPLGPLPRFAVSQLTLRVPAFRRITKPPPSVNVKGLGLFLGAAVRARDVIGNSRARDLSLRLVGEIERRGTSIADGIGWGYPFPWQSRSFWAPGGTPNAVVTAMVGWHLLDCAEVFRDERALALGAAAARFLATGLHVTRIDECTAALSYTPMDRSRVVNVSALAARLLLRTSALSDAINQRSMAEELLRFALLTQREDGSWPYAAERGGDWEDSFHTGFVLESLLDSLRYGFEVPNETIARGFLAYQRFFGPTGEARLSHDLRSPLDAHSAAQGIITYATLASNHSLLPHRHRASAMAVEIARWALSALWLPDRRYFAHRISGGRRDERDFMRWVQSWMALGMATVSVLNGSAGR